MWPPACPSGSPRFVWQYLHHRKTKTVYRLMWAASSGELISTYVSLVYTCWKHCRGGVPTTDVNIIHNYRKCREIMNTLSFTFGANHLWGCSWEWWRKNWRYIGLKATYYNCSQYLHFLSTFYFFGLSVHFGPAWNISTTIRWIVIKFCMNFNDFGNILTFSVVPPEAQSFH